MRTCTRRSQYLFLYTDVYSNVSPIIYFDISNIFGSVWYLSSERSILKNLHNTSSLFMSGIEFSRRNMGSNAFILCSITDLYVLPHQCLGGNDGSLFDNLYLLVRWLYNSNSSLYRKLFRFSATSLPFFHPNIHWYITCPFTVWVNEDIFAKKCIDFHIQALNSSISVVDRDIIGIIVVCICEYAKVYGRVVILIDCYLRNISIINCPMQRIILQPRLNYYIRLHEDEGIEVTFINLEFKHYYDRNLKRVTRFTCTCKYNFEDNCWEPINKNETVTKEIGYETEYPFDDKIEYDVKTQTVTVSHIDWNTQYAFGWYKPQTKAFRVTNNINGMLNTTIKEQIVLPNKINVLDYPFCDCCRCDKWNTDDKSDQGGSFDYNDYIKPNDEHNWIKVTLYNLPRDNYYNQSHITAFVINKLLPFDVPNKCDLVRSGNKLIRNKNNYMQCHHPWYNNEEHVYELKLEYMINYIYRNLYSQYSLAPKDNKNININNGNDRFHKIWNEHQITISDPTIFEEYNIENTSTPLTTELNTNILPNWL